MKKIRLTSYDLTENPQWVPGQVVDVTPENEQRAKAVVKNRGAVTLNDVQEKASEQPVDDDDDEDLEDLALTDSVERLAEFTVHGRYIAAFKDAGHNTIADVVAIEDLVSVSGISPKGAEQIQEVLNDELED